MSAGIPLLSRESEVSTTPPPSPLARRSEQVELGQAKVGTTTKLNLLIACPQDYPQRPSERYNTPPPSALHRIAKSTSPLRLAFLCLALVLVGSGLEAARSRLAGSLGGGHVKLDRSRLAVLLEKRNEPILAPILLDFIAKVPAAYPFQVWTEDATADFLKTVTQLKPHLASGKLTLKLLPYPGNIYDGNSLSSFMADPWWWEQLAPAEQSVRHPLRTSEPPALRSVTPP